MLILLLLSAHLSAYNLRAFDLRAFSSTYLDVYKYFDRTHYIHFITN